MKELDQFTVERLQAFIDKPLDNGFTRYEQMVLAYLALAVKQSEPVAYVTFNGCLINACDPKLPEYSDPQPLYDAPVLNSPEAPDGWVACSERVPENNEQVLTWNGQYKTTDLFLAGSFLCNKPNLITHWMPLLAAPKPEK